jgi:hypothetical protein
LIRVYVEEVTLVTRQAARSRIYRPVLAATFNPEVKINDAAAYAGSLHCFSCSAQVFRNSEHTLRISDEIHARARP